MTTHPTETSNDDWARLERPSDFDPANIRQSRGVDAKVLKFPCESCGGSGKYRGVRLHQLDDKCFACGGKGYFKHSERDRQASRTKRQDNKARRLKDAQDAFDAANPDVVAFLRSAVQWSGFATSMCSAIAQYGALTDRQLVVVYSMMAKSAARQQERQRERAAGNATVDLAPIRAMFEMAVTSGYKRPIYRAADLVITRAPDHGRNPGALYVMSAGDNGDYLGKIIGTAYTGKPAPALAAIAADPRGEAIRYGQRTGTCSCCGRELTKEASIEAGIGPICASKWGL